MSRPPRNEREAWGALADADMRPWRQRGHHLPPPDWLDDLAAVGADMLRLAAIGAALALLIFAVLGTTGAEAARCPQWTGERCPVIVVAVPSIEVRP